MLRGDTDFTQTERLDAWDAEGVKFIFGMDVHAQPGGDRRRACPHGLGELQRPPQYKVKGPPRRRPEQVKERIVGDRGFKTLTW